ncbi:MAG TPA: hypothetical protein VKV16_07980, partial [Solirubrobacteraceae bacterium]|nr:hypothetical protein [Solirubrobacteraceae bacterium]
PLYCYRPLTADFIAQRLGMLVALESYAPAARALEASGGVELYLRCRGVPPSSVDAHPRALAELALRELLARVFEERSGFELHPERFELAYAELERAIYADRCLTEVIAPLYGVDLDARTEELAIGDGVSIVRAHTLAGVPSELTAGEHPPLLLLLRVAHEPGEQPSPAFARARLRRVLTALRLFERGAYALGPIGYSRLDAGAFAPVALGFGGRPRRLTLIPRDSEDELRAFCNLIARRLPRPGSGGGPDRSGSGELSWALARFEMGCERAAAFESLTDHLLALRALLEPEGPGSGRLAQRLSMICAAPPQRAALAQQTARAIALERAVIAGLASSDTELELLADEMAEHLRAILRDILCGHLDTDVRAVADELLAESVKAGQEPVAAP